MILQIIQQILGITIFFLPGILLSYIIEPKTDIIKRLVYSIVLAPCIVMLGGLFLYFLNLLTAINIIIVLVFINILFLLLILASGNKHKTNFNKDIFYLIFFTIIGVFWRLRFLNSVENFLGAYTYAGIFTTKTVPDLGFYTGMAIDHSRFIGMRIFYKISKFLLINNFLNFVGIFLITFLFLGFIYLIFYKYKYKKFAFIGVALMCFGPIEIFYNTTSFFGHPFSYLTLFSLFLLYKSENKKYFLVPFLLSTTMMFTYYTASMVIILTSTGFILALFIKDLFTTKKLLRTFKNSLKNRKILSFLLILIIVASYIYLFSYMLEFTTEKTKDLPDLLKVISSLKTPSTIYKDPTFLRLSAIRWQMLFFFLCGLTFIFRTAKSLIKKDKLSKKNLDLLLCLIPILVVSFGFLYVNLPTRIFNYFAFFGLLVIKIPRKYLNIFLILSFIFLLITGFYVIENKRIFFENSDKEIEGAIWINNSLKGKIFSDQAFINQLVLNGYYNVTGADDGGPIVYNLFYQDNQTLFLNTINTLNKDLDVDYIVITKRMQEKYILMVNIYQRGLINIYLYEQNLEKVYDNGEVMIYKIKK
jgi:hypothetical protein